MCKNRFLLIVLLTLLAAMFSCGGAGGGDDSSSNAELQNTQWSVYSRNGRYAVRGQFTNTGSATGWYVNIEARLYNSSGNYLGRAWGYVNGRTRTNPFGFSDTSTIAPGETASFDIFSLVSLSQVARVVRIVDWSEWPAGLKKDYDKEFRQREIKRSKEF